MNCYFLVCVFGVDIFYRTKLQCGIALFINMQVVM